MDNRIIIRTWMATAALILSSTASAAYGDEIRYFAWDAQQSHGVVETTAGARSVALGDWLAGFGTVVALDESHVVFRRVLSEAERADLESRGFIGHSAEEIEVIREDLRFVGIPYEPAGSNP